MYASFTHSTWHSPFSYQRIVVSFYLINLVTTYCNLPRLDEQLLSKTIVMQSRQDTPELKAKAKEHGIMGIDQ